MSTVTAIVVSYNSVNELPSCLNALKRENCDEIIVIDNNSQDGSADYVEQNFPEVVLIKNSENYGYGKACNQGLSIATFEYALILNSDTIAQPNSISRLKKFLDRQNDAVACGGGLFFPDGRLQESAANELTLWVVFCEQTYLEKVFTRSSLFSPYWVSRKHVLKNGFEAPLEVEQVMGACLMMRRIDGKFLRFDERFFLYCEDTELCSRLKQKGKIFYVPNARFIHLLGKSSVNERWKSISYYNCGKERYFSLKKSTFAAFLCFAFNRFGALFRLSIWTALLLVSLGRVANSAQKVGVWAKVLVARIDPYPNN